MNVITKAAVAALSIGWVASAHAVPIVGSVGFSDGANETGASLLTRTSFIVPNAETQPFATRDFAPIVANLPVTISNFTVPAAVLPAPSASNFSASFAGGTFLAASAQKTDQFTTADNLSQSITVLFIGTFDPDGVLSSFDNNAASVTAVLNRQGNGIDFTVTSAFTLAAPPVGSPPVEVPEPASMALLGLGLAGLGVMRRRMG